MRPDGAKYLPETIDKSPHERMYVSWGNKVPKY
jgi:hypothetical protein